MLPIVVFKNSLEAWFMSEYLLVKGWLEKGLTDLDWDCTFFLGLNLLGWWRDIIFFIK